jgi:hypothetical protein
MSRRAIRACAAMQRLLDALPSSSLPPLSGRLLRIIDDGVIERDGCVLLRALAEGETFDPERHGNRSAFECAVNRLVFEAAGISTERALATALTCAGQLMEMLERPACAGPFRVIVAQDDTGCAVSFHRHRAEEQAGLAEEGERAVLVLECGFAFA